jgi:undecaprenyl-diphosphatase
MDTALLHALNGFTFRHDAFEDPLALYVSGSQILFLALVVLLGLADAGSGWRRRAAVAGGLGAGFALACAQVISRLVDRPRPFVDDPAGVHLFVRHAADASFPSDHATAAFAIATAVALRHRRWGAVVLMFAGVLAAGRVALGIHYPTDVLAGAALGAAASLLVYAPAIRRRVDNLADAVGAQIEMVAALALRRRPSPD